MWQGCGWAMEMCELTRFLMWEWNGEDLAGMKTVMDTISNLQIKLCSFAFLKVQTWSKIENFNYLQQINYFFFFLRNNSIKILIFTYIHTYKLGTCGTNRAVFLMYLYQDGSEPWSSYVPLGLYSLCLSGWTKQILKKSCYKSDFSSFFRIHKESCLSCQRLQHLQPDAEDEAGFSSGHFLLKTSFVIWGESLKWQKEGPEIIQGLSV